MLPIQLPPYSRTLDVDKLGNQSMAKPDWKGRRKRRPREHVIAEMGVNFLERQVLRREHQLLRVPQPEYGTDALMMHFDPETRELENGWVEFQVKATDRLKLVNGNQHVSCHVDSAHLRQWYYQIAHPFVLVVYDATHHCAYWLDVQAYVDALGMADDEPLAERVNLRIPARNRLTPRAIEHFRQLSIARQSGQEPS